MTTTDQTPAINPITVGTVSVAVSCDPDGMFHATWLDIQYHAKSRDQLAVLLLDAARQNRIRVSVPFHMVQSDDVVAGTATGIHAGSGQILANLGPRGKTQQLRSYDTYLDLDDEGVARLRAIIKARQAIVEEYREFIAAHALPLDKLVKAAIGDVATG